MATPIGWDSTVEPLCGENDPFGREDTANKYARTLWANFIVEHNQSDGSHKAPWGVIESGTYTGTGQKRIISLENTNLIISDLQIAAHDTYSPQFATAVMNGVVVSGGTGKLGIESDSVDGNTTFTDVYGIHTITPHGDTQHKTAINQSWNPTSIYFDGTGDYLSIPDHADWDFGTDIFAVTFDCYFVDKAANTYACFLDHDDWRIWYEDGNTRITITIEGTAYHYTWTPANNTWYRIKVTRITTDALLVIVNGTSVGSEPGIVADITGSANALTIGCDTSATAAYFFNGYMNDIHIAYGGGGTYERYDWSNTYQDNDTIWTSDKILRIGTGRFQLGENGEVNRDAYIYSYVATGVIP